MPHKLDPYAGIIDSRLDEFPGLSAQRLFDEVRAAGYIDRLLHHCRIVTTTGTQPKTS